jgi:lipoprotein NlpD
MKNCLPLGAQRQKAAPRLVFSAMMGLSLSLGLVGCSSTINQAPVIDRLPSRNLEGPASGHAMVSTDGHYTVKQGDTLYAIALEFGLDWRELAKANGLGDPGKLVVGQRLRVENLAAANGTNSADTSSNGVVEVTPVVPLGLPKANSAVAPGSPAPVADPAPQPEAPPSKPAPFAATPGFVLPHPGDIIQPYKPGVNKGIDFAAKIGDPVVAAQAGKVVYSGNALRGYGNLVILKHDNNILTAYAHNKTLLVKEGDVVTKGQKIAEAGQSDADRPKLHFEVRKQGKPVDPTDYLPKR